MAPNQLLAASQTFNLTGPGIPVTNAATQFETFAGQVIGALTIIAVLYFVAQVIFAGYSFISSQGDQKVMETNRHRLTEAVLGLVVIIVAVGLASLVASLFGIQNVLDINGMFAKMGL